MGEASKNGVGSNPRDALKKFWEEQYHAGNVRLVVVGKNSLDELSEMVTETFSEVRPAPKNFEPYSGTPGEKVFPEGTSLGLIREVRPVKDRRSIKISFDIPSCKTEGSRESKPHRILSHLIGYEGPGSFHDVMVGEGFVRGVSAGIGIDGSDFSLFTISISLTEKGSASTDIVIESFFQWLALIKSTPLELFEEYHEEQQSLANMFFKFSENGDPTSFASSSAEVLFKYPASELLTGPSLLKEFNPALFSTYLSRFDPSNSIVTISDPSLDPELPSDKDNVDKLVTAAGQKWDVEPWYRAPYRQALLSAEAKSKLADPPKMDGRFKLPAKNPFIPDSFSIVKADGTRAEVRTCEEPCDELRMCTCQCRKLRLHLLRHFTSLTRRFARRSRRNSLQKLPLSIQTSRAPRILPSSATSIRMCASSTRTWPRRTLLRRPSRTFI